jgi:hypothetical protein
MKEDFVQDRTILRYQIIFCLVEMENLSASM